MKRSFQTIKKTLQECRDDNKDPYLAMLALRTTKSNIGTCDSKMQMNRKLQTLVHSLNVNVNTKTKITKLIVSQSRELQTIEQKQHGPLSPEYSCTQTGIILNKNKMHRSHTLLNNRDNVIRRNRRHLIKMVSNFVKTENDIDNNIETKL